MSRGRDSQRLTRERRDIYKIVRKCVVSAQSDPLLTQRYCLMQGALESLMISIYNRVHSLEKRKLSEDQIAVLSLYALFLRKGRSHQTTVNQARQQVKHNHQCRVPGGFRVSSPALGAVIEQPSGRDMRWLQTWLKTSSQWSRSH